MIEARRTSSVPGASPRGLPRVRVFWGGQGKRDPGRGAGRPSSRDVTCYAEGADAGGGLLHRANDERPTRSAAPWAAALALLLGTGCLNTDLPTVPATPPAPALNVLTPKPGDTIALTAQVDVSAASVNGISSVTVLCGPPDAGARTVYTWPAAPYLALVDFSTCQSLAYSNPDGGLALLALSVVALTDAGASQAVDFPVQFNTQGPVLTVLYPPSAQPKAPFTVLVSSDESLRSFPLVGLAGNGPTSVTSAPNPDGGLPIYSAYFATTPGLGTDNAPYTPGVPVPIEILTDTSETVRLTVSAVALNGNTTQLDLGVELTRVVWDVYIPGVPASSGPIDWAAEPVAFEQGLELPLSTTAGGGATAAWLPGVLARADGTFHGFNPAVLDGGYLPTGLNSQGEMLAFAFTGNGSHLLLTPAPGVNAPLLTAAGGPVTATAPLTRVDNLLCLQDSVTTCFEDNVDNLVCYSPQLTAVTAVSQPVTTGPPTPGVVAGAGGRYLSPNVGICGSSWNLADLGLGTFTFGPTVDPNGCNIQSVDKLLAVGDGTFVVQLTSNCDDTNFYPILRVGAGSQILGSYTAAQGNSPTVRAELVAALADGRVVTLQNAPPYTNFQLWSLGSINPDIVTPIAGLYDTADNAVASVLAKSTYSATDGSFAVLLYGGEFNVDVLAFGPNLQPLWLYVYPRVTLATSSRLVSASSVGDVYVIDEFNNYALSLRVAPQAIDGGAPDAGGFTVDGYVVDSHGIPAPAEAIVVVSTSGTQTTTSDGDGGFSLANVGVPYTLSAVASGTATTYVGLTIPNPTIQLPYFLGGSRYGTVSLTADAGPAVAGDAIYLLFISPQAVVDGYFSPLDEPGMLSVDWSGPPTTSGNLYALEDRTTDGGGGIPAGYAYGVLSGLEFQDQTTVNQSLTLNPVVNGTLSGTANWPEGASFLEINVTLITDAASNSGIAYMADTSGATSFSYPTPTIPGTSLLLTAYANTATDNIVVNIAGLAANTSGLTVNIPTTALTQTAPPNMAQGVTTATLFTSSTFPGAIYNFQMNTEGNSFSIWTASPSTTIPDLSAAGFTLSPGTSYVWSVTAYGPITTVDALAAPYQGSSFTVASPLIYFTTNQ